MPYKDAEKQREHDRQKYLKNRKKYLERSRKQYWGNKPKAQAYYRKYGKKNRKKISARVRAWRKNLDAEKKRKYRASCRKAEKRQYEISPEKFWARNTLNHAVKTGRIVRPDHCTRCGLVCTPEGHHPDYSKPLKVIWLCDLCHRFIHTKIRR